MQSRIITFIQLSALFLFISFQSIAQTQPLPLYKDPSAGVDARVKDLLNRMTLQEKIGQMRHIHVKNFDSNGKPDLKKLDGYTKGLGFGCLEASGYPALEYAKALFLIQKRLIEETRLGIPVIPVAESLHGIPQPGCTIYPQAVALGSTFNPDLAYQMTLLISLEAKAMGVKQVLAPDLDLARELRWGRVEETFGEDPFFNGVFGVAYVKGFHENSIICTLKHFAAHGSPAGGLNLASVEGGERALFSTYLQPFEKVIKENNVLSVMNCYSSYDGQPVAGSPYFLTEILRNKLGFKGYVYSDWGSVSMLHSFHRTAKDGADAAVQAVKAGVDMEAGSSDFSQLEKMVLSGMLSEDYIDTAVTHILYVKIISGLFDKPFPDTSSFSQKIHSRLSVNMAKQIADESIVLLKNEKQLLPLDPHTLKSIAVIGPASDRVQFGDYTWSRNNKDGVTPLSGIRKMAGSEIRINYARGCDYTSVDKSGFSEAVSAARQSDVAVLFVGSQSAADAVREYANSTSGEGYDLSDLNLTGVQEYLVEAVYGAGKPVVLVLVTGRPFAIKWIKENIPAIVVQWYGGEQQGNAIADMLFGRIDPSGRLPVSFPQSMGHLPVYYNYLPSDKGYYRQRGSVQKPGRDYVFSSPDALFLSDMDLATQALITAAFPCQKILSPKTMC